MYSLKKLSKQQQGAVAALMGGGPCCAVCSGAASVVLVWDDWLRVWVRNPRPAPPIAIQPCIAEEIPDFYLLRDEVLGLWTQVPKPLVKLPLALPTVRHLCAHCHRHNGTLSDAPAPEGLPYRGTSLIRNTPFLGPYSRTIPRVLRGRAVSYERGTPVG